MYRSYKLKTDRKPAMLLGLSLAVLSIVVFFFSQMNYGYKNHPSLRFTPEIWKVERASHSKKLDWIAKDLSETKSFVGMERATVIAQLGIPDYCNYKDGLINGAPNQNPKYPTNLIYYLSTRTKQLILPLSKEDKVENVIYGSTGGL